MRGPLFVLVTTFLVATVSAQLSSDYEATTLDIITPVACYSDYAYWKSFPAPFPEPFPNPFQNRYWKPFQNPGEIIPGLTISYLINATGGIWQQERVIDSIAYVCSDVLPYLRSKMPMMEWVGLFVDHVCKHVSNAADDLEAFDAEHSCNKLTSVISNVALNNRFRRQVETLPEDYFDIFEILANIIRDLYGIDVYDQSTICPNVQQFLEPSLPDVTTRFTAELVSALLPQAVSDICQDWPDHWEDYFSSFGFRTPSRTFHHIIHDGVDIGSRLLGYESRTDICTAMMRALSIGEEERRAFGRNAFESVFNIFTDVDKCVTIVKDAVDDIIEPIFVIFDFDLPEYKVGSYVIQIFTGIEGVQEMCTALKTAFIPTRSLSIGAIIGIGVVVAVVRLLAIIIFIVYRRIHQGQQRAC